MIEFHRSPKQWDGILQALTATNINIAMVVTGGGTGVIPLCFGRVGASRNFVEANVPYSRVATQQYLGFKPADSYASASTAHALARAAHARAQKQTDTQAHSPGLSLGSLGISLSAALPTHPMGHDNRENASQQDAKTSIPDYQIHVASHDTMSRRSWSLHFSADQCNRTTAESIAEQMFLAALAASIDESKRQPHGDPLSPLLAAGLAITKNMEQPGSDNKKS